MKKSATTLRQMRPLLPVRLFNGFGALLEKSRIPSTRLSAADLIATAKRRSSLDDFGEGDFSEALSRLLDSCQDEARLNLIGKIALKTDVLETLCARLQMERDRQFYPDITHQEIREPHESPVEHRGLVDRRGPALQGSPTVGRDRAQTT